MADNDHGEPWVLPFVDIIYVATLVSIDEVVIKCGSFYLVYLMAAAYLTIMFSTRLAVDNYTLQFGHVHSVESKEYMPYHIVYVLLGLCIYVMTLNIAVDDETSGEHEYSTEFGHCASIQHYDNGFAAAYIGTRVFIIGLHAVEPKLPVGDRWWHAVAPSAGIVVMAFAFGSFKKFLVFPIAAGIEALLTFSICAAGLIKTKPDPEGLKNRLGLFFMLVLGEMAVGVLVENFNTSQLGPMYSTILSGFFLIFAVGVQFYEILLLDETHTTWMPLSEDSSGDKSWRYAPYVWLHLVIGAFMLLATNGVIELYRFYLEHDDIEAEVDASEIIAVRWRMAIGLCGVSFLLIYMRALYVPGRMLPPSFPLNLDGTKNKKATVNWQWWLNAIVGVVHLFVPLMGVRLRYLVLVHACLEIVPLSLKNAFKLESTLAKDIASPTSYREVEMVKGCDQLRE